MKLDCDLSALDDNVTAHLDTKSLLTLRLNSCPGHELICCLGEQTLGGIDPGVAANICKHLATAGHDNPGPGVELPLKVVIRSIKRSPESKRVTHVQVRVTDVPAEVWQARVRSATSVKPVLEAPMLEDLEKDGRFVTQEQFEEVAASASIRAKLGDAELRKLIRTVDSAQARDAALSAAMDNPHFAAFCEEILDIVSPVQ